MSALTSVRASASSSASSRGGWVEAVLAGWGAPSCFVVACKVCQHSQQQAGHSQPQAGCQSAAAAAWTGIHVTMHDMDVCMAARASYRGTPS